MTKRLALLVSICFSLTCFSQNFIDKSRKKVVAHLNKHILKSQMKATIQETDSTVRMLVRDPKFKPAEFTYYFNQEDKCISEISEACDSCVNGYFAKAIKDQSYKWMKVNPATFLSKYSKHLIAEVLSNNGSAFLRVRKINWTKAQYAQYLDASKQ